jgi:hypothetical protein
LRTAGDAALRGGAREDGEDEEEDEEDEEEK